MMTRKINAMLIALGVLLNLNPLASNAESVKLKLLNGEVIQVGSVRDKPLYLKFWATWCGECRKQMHHLETVYKKYHNKLDVVAVNFAFNDTRDLIEKYRKKNGLTVPISFDPLGLTQKKLNVWVVPYSILINRKGKIIHSRFGIDGVDDKITKLIEAR